MAEGAVDSVRSAVPPEESRDDVLVQQHDRFHHLLHYCCYCCCRCCCRAVHVQLVGKEEGGGGTEDQGVEVGGWDGMQHFRLARCCCCCVLLLCCRCFFAAAAWRKPLVVSTVAAAAAAVAAGSSSASRARTALVGMDALILLPIEQ